MKATILELRKRLRYDPNTGEFTWKYQPDMPDSFNNRWAEKPALTYMDKYYYKRGTMDGEVLLAHRTAWAMYYGEYCKGIYHYNNCKWDNRIFNLKSHKIPGGFPVSLITRLKDQGALHLIQAPQAPLPFPEQKQTWKVTTLADMWDELEKPD
jgi:hypothetical protein